MSVGWSTEKVEDIKMVEVQKFLEKVELMHTPKYTHLPYVPKALRRFSNPYFKTYGKTVWTSAYNDFNIIKR